MKLFKIGDICELLAITPRTIRYYDQLGLLPNVKRSDGFTRLFDQNDIDLIKEIRKLQKSKAMPLTMIKEKLFPNNIKSKSVLLITDSIIATTSRTLTEASRLESPWQGNKKPKKLIIIIIFLNIFTY